MTRSPRNLPRSAAGPYVVFSAVLLAGTMQPADAGAQVAAAGVWHPSLPALDISARDPDARLHLVQRYDEGSESDFSTDSSGGSEPPGVRLDGGTPISGGENISRQLDRAAEACGELRREYRVHCLANQYEALARQMPRDGAYSDMHDAIAKAARDLRALAEANRDPAAPLVQAPDVGPGVARVGRQPLPAVRQDRLEATARAAERIIEDTATVLLRSAENSRNRFVSYQRVAAAVDSTKVLLRST